MAACAEKFGAATTLGELLDMFMSKCAGRSEIHKPQKYGTNCSAYCPDIGRTSRSR
ncbi:hypothetical protein BIWAKO_06652 [Bosea sp. BIWAKO-01]|nr:hypothetical protein BIWAKO_06652 [Bosea sp. BIWAKO-01]